MAATGTLDGDRVFVPEEREANVLYNKGFFGYPQSGGVLELDLLEAVYLAEMNRLDVKTGDGRALAPGDLLVTAADLEDGFAVRYVVYRDLRQRGFVTRASNVTDFNVYPRGAVLGKAPSKFLVRALGERTRFDPAAVAAEAERSAELKKALLLAVVDEEGDLTYYGVSLQPPTGHAPPVKLALADAPPAHLLAERVVVTHEPTADVLNGKAFMGRRIGPVLQLSLTEAVYLADEADLRIADGATGALLDRDALFQRAHAVEGDFDLRYALHRDLAARGLVVKTGFKYGTHFRAYRGDPDEQHAPFLVHALPEGDTLAWPDVAGFVRLAHGVRKDVHFQAGGVFVRLKRTRP